MPTRNVVLTDRQADLIEELVSSGRYQNASEVLRDGLRLIERRDEEEKTRLKVLREAVQVGIDAYEVGDYQQLDSKEAIDRYMEDLTEEAIGSNHKASRKR